MNPKKLVKLLRNEYGQANFRVEVCFFTHCQGICPWLRNAAQLRLDQYKIYVLDQERARSPGLTQV